MTDRRDRGWDVAGGDSADHAPETDFYRPAENVGFLHLAIGIERRTAGEFDFLSKHNNPDDPVVRLRTLVVWKQGAAEPPTVYRGTFGGDEDIVLPQRRLVPVLAAYAGELKPVAAFLEKPGQAFEFRTPNDRVREWVSKWMGEWFHVRDGVAVCHYQPPGSGPAPSPGPGPAPSPGPAPGPDAGGFDPGPVWEQPQHRQPTPPAAPAAPAAATPTGNAAVDRERMEAPF